MSKEPPFETNELRHGGPAFGHAAENGHCCGMTLRDYFAAKAMSALMQAHDGYKCVENYCGDRSPQSYAKSAYGMADAMLQERSKQ